jgi:HEAT repeat protein
MRPRNLLQVLGAAAGVALGALIAFGEAEGVDPSVERAIQALEQDPSLKVRAQAALLLGQKAAAEGMPALLVALEKDSSAAVRLAAAAALGRIGDPAAREPLARAANSDADPGVRSAAAAALQDLAERLRTRTRAVAIEEVQGKGTPAARLALREALARHLADRGFPAAAPDDSRALRLKASVLALDVAESGGRVLIDVRASAMAVEPGGRMAAMSEGAARLRTQGGRLTRERQEQLAARALDAAARMLSDELVAELR